MIQPSLSPPAATIRCFGKIHAGLPCPTDSSIQRRCAQRNERLLYFARSAASYMHIDALRSCASLVSIFRRYQATCIVSVAACSSASVWASPLQPRPGLLRSRDGIINPTVRMMAAANVASTPSTLLSPGGFVLRCPPTDVCSNLLSKLGISH